MKKRSGYAMAYVASVSTALTEALREAQELASAGQFGDPLQEVLAHARELVELADETLAADPHAGEHARGMAMHMAEKLAAVENLLKAGH